MQRLRHGKGRRRYIAIHSIVCKMSSKVPIEQVLASLEDSFNTSRENLPAELTSESSLLRLTEEVKQNSRKKKPAKSANFKKVCEGVHMFLYQNQRYDHILTCIDLINNEAEESSPHKKNPMPMKCVECEVKRKELRLARKRIAELTKELGAVKRAKT